MGEGLIMKNNLSRWYRDFLISHPEEEKQGRMDEIENEQFWNLKHFRELLDINEIPEEEVKYFRVSRRPWSHGDI